MSISLLVRRQHDGERQAQINYAAVPPDWRKEQKYEFLAEKQDYRNVDWQKIEPDKNNTWLTEGLQSEFEAFLPMAAVKSAKQKEVIFNICSNGVKTNRDIWLYNFNYDKLSKNVQSLIDAFNEQVLKWSILIPKPRVDDFVVNDDRKISWSAGLKNALKRQINIKYEETNLRRSIYRPFTQKYLYFDRHIIERCYNMNIIFPSLNCERDNLIIGVLSIGGRSNFFCFCSDYIVDMHFNSIDAIQCFPFFIYSEDGINRRENLTDWALAQFRAHYRDEAITKWDIFHYVYALLHHPGYREKYAANLRRELPRIPFAPDFRAFAAAGTKLADLHVNYEQQQEYPLTFQEKPGAPLDWRVVRMKLSRDKTEIIYNNFPILMGIPPAVFDYKLGNRSALEWVIDQYRVSTDKRSGITNDPNRADAPQYIVRLVGQVITVSLETLKIIISLPELA